MRRLYAENHAHQTLAFVREKQAQYFPLRRARMGVWEAMGALESLVDESDPDLELPQIQHALQTAEALRVDGAPDWLVSCGLLHDLGKVLCLFGEPQWAVVGDTFPVGCAFDARVVYADLFAANPDVSDPALSSHLGIYREGCGLDTVTFSWGHDEYLYHVLRPYLTDEALYVIRYHSFYAAHREGAYEHLFAARDREWMRHVADFSRYDLYSKVDEPLPVAELRPRYEELLEGVIPPTLQW